MFRIVPQNHVDLVSRFGKYTHYFESGFNMLWLWPFQETIRVSLQKFSLITEIETKTKDDVFVSVKIDCQHRIIKNLAHIYCFEMNRPEEQMKNYVFDIVRAEVPKITLDAVFEQKDQITKTIKSYLKDIFLNYGVELIDCLIVDIAPDLKVKNAMNKINEEQRLRKAAFEKAEAEKLNVIIAAQAEAERRKLHGEGIANERKAIVEGLKESLDELKKNGQTSEQVITLLLANQYFDTLQSMSKHSNSTTIFNSSNVTGFAEIVAKLQESINLK